MSEPAPGNPTADRNLLFGILAVQMDFVSREALVAAMHAWVLAKHRSLGDLLQEQGALTPQQRRVLDLVAEEHLKAHGGDAQQSLAVLRQQSTIGVALGSVADGELQASLAVIGATLATTDDHGPPPDGMRYRVLRPHAQGGLGVVSVARDTELGREVALKEIQAGHAKDAISRDRFVREAEITGGLEHPGIVPVYGLGRYDDGRPYYAMRFIRGESLQEAIKKLHMHQAGYSLRGLLTRFVAACNAIAYAHSRGVIHRDIKPSNVMLGPYGETLVVDWGLAKVIGRESTDGEDSASAELTFRPPSGDSSATQAGSALGTPAFMSPEQARGEVTNLGPATDIYSLGATLYTLLTGRPPIQGRTTAELLENVRLGNWKPARQLQPNAPKPLDAIAGKALAMKLRDRYGTALELAAEVERWLADEPVLGHHEPWITRAGRWVKRHRQLVTGAVVLLLAALGGLTAVLAVQRQANAMQRQANVELEAKNAELAEQKAEAEVRFATAQKAIATLHTGISEDFLLKNPEFKELRTKLLRDAAGFYSDLDKLLAGKSDAKSRKLLADGYFQLGDLTAKIGDHKEALAVQRKALALRRELASTPGADVETRLDVARSLRAVALLLRDTGDIPGTLSAFQEQRDLAATLEAEAPSDAVRTQLAYARNGIGFVLSDMGKPSEGLKELQKALAIRQELVNANPAVPAYQSELAGSHMNIGNTLRDTGQPAEAMHEYRTALAIVQKLANANPGVMKFQSEMAMCHDCLGYALSWMGKPAEALSEYQKALPIHQKLADANPAVTPLQSYVAMTHSFIGRLQARQKRFSEAFVALNRGLVILQRLADANATNTDFMNRLGESHASRGWAHFRAGHSAEAAADLRCALALWEKAKNLDVETRFERSRALALLAGLARDGKSGVTAAEAASFADQAVAALHDAVQAGWVHYDELKEPDFDPLRGRDEFKKLVAGLEAKFAAEKK
jgi:serine/threonine-protein kinase